jgi:hypothetical protein
MFPSLDDALNTFVIGLGMLPWSNFRVENRFWNFKRYSLIILYYIYENCMGMFSPLRKSRKTWQEWPYRDLWGQG